MRVSNIQHSIAKYRRGVISSGVSNHLAIDNGQSAIRENAALRAPVPFCGLRLGRHDHRAFSLIEMMIAIVILGLGLVMTATMFPIAWTRARSLTEYTTQRAVAQSAAAALSDSLQASGSTFTPFELSGTKTGKYFLSSGSLAGDLFYDPVLHTDPDPSLKLPCAGIDQCYSHLSILIPSDTRVHALHMENLNASKPTEPPVGERPFAIERMIELCDLSKKPMVCRTGYPLGNPFMQCDSPVNDGAEFCSRSFYSPQVRLEARLYPPMEAQPTDSNAIEPWLEKFNTHRYAWAALHRLRNPVGPVNVPPPPDPLLTTLSKEYAAQAALAAGTTRTFDFYVVTLKRAQSTSRFAVQDPETSPLTTATELATPTPFPEAQDVALPVAWRVQVELPLSLASTVVGTPTGVATEIQVPPANFTGSREMMTGMFPTGTQFVDEITGQILRVVRRRFNAAGDIAFLTLDRELFLQDFDNSPEFGGDGTLQKEDVLRTVWVFPPPIVDRSNATTVAFDDTSPVVGIDVRTISISPPG